MIDNVPIRKPVRLSGYNYSEDGVYFVTICTQNRQELLGSIKNGRMILNEIGEMINDYWIKLPTKYENVIIDEYMIMPDHFHGLIAINWDFVGAHPRVRPNSNESNISGPTHGSAPTLGNIIQWFKTMTTNEYMNHVYQNDWPRFNKKFWQRGYYDHVIRDEEDLHRTRYYIKQNPAKWEEEKITPP